MNCDNRTPAQKVSDELCAASGDLAESGMLPDSGQRTVHTQTQDAYGGRTETWPDSGLPFPCLLASIVSFMEVSLGERMGERRPNLRLTVPRTVDLNVSDRVRINGTRTVQILTQEEANSLGFVSRYGCVEL